MSDQLKNLDSTLIQNEYMVRVYSEYLLGACCLLLSIHDLTRSQISDLENLTHSYLKCWLGLPSSMGGTRRNPVTDLFQELIDCFHYIRLYLEFQSPSICL